MTATTVWNEIILGNSVRDWTFALVAFLVTFTLLPLARGFVLAQRKRFDAADVPFGVELGLRLIARTTRLFLWMVALYLAQRFLELPPRLERGFFVVSVVVFWMQAALWGTAAVRFALDRQRERRDGQIDPAFKGSLDIILFVARLVIFAVALLLALDNLGVNITALVAGLGIGGIAIALAVQTVLGDLLASLSIAIDKPFVVGEALRIDDIEGVVEHVGFRSTRLRSVSGEQVIVANADILKSRVRNLGKAAERRTLFTLALAHGATAAQLDQVPVLVRDAVESQEGARFEYCVFRSFGEASLNFEVCYFVLDPVAPRLLPILDGVNRRIYAAFEQAGIRFAFPTRVVHWPDPAPSIRPPAPPAAQTPIR